MSICSGINNVVNYTYSDEPTLLSPNASIITQQVQQDFRFRTFFNGNGILIDETSNPGGITISYTGAPGAGYNFFNNSIMNSSANVYDSISGNNVFFRPLIEGPGIDIVESSGITISATPYTYSTVNNNFDATLLSPTTPFNFRFKGLVQGTNIVFDEVTSPGNIRISSISQIQLQENNTLFVDEQFGSDFTGTRERRDLPYRTITQAANDALTGDTIYVLPGNYTDSITISTSLNFHLVDGANWLSSNAPLLTVNGSFTVSFSGDGVYTSSLIGASIITGNPSNVYFSGKELNILNSSTGFNLTNSNLYVDVPLINGTGSATLTSLTCTSLFNIKIVSGVLRTFARLLSASGPLNYELNTNLLGITTNNTIGIDYSGEYSNISINANVSNIVLNGLMINVVDTNASINTKSQVHFCFNSHSTYVNGDPFISLNSTKTLNFVPQAFIKSDNFIISQMSSLANPNFIFSNGGDINVTIKNLELLSATNNGNLAQVTGAFTLSSDRVNWISNFVNATECYISCNDFSWHGIMNSTNGFIKSESMNGFANAQITGTWEIDSNKITITGTNSVTMIQPTNITIRANSLQFNTSTSNLAINIQPTNSLTLKVASLVFTYSGSHNLINNFGRLLINSNFIKDLVFINYAECTISCDYLKCENFTSNFVFDNRGTSTLNLGLVEIDNFPNMFTNLGETNIVIQKLIHQSSSISSNVFRSSGTINLTINEIIYNPTISGTFLIMNAGGGNFFTKRISSSTLATNVIHTFGNSNINVKVDYGLINCRFIDISSSTSKTIVSCEDMERNANGEIIRINTSPSGIIDIKGTYRTLGPNVIQNSGTLRLSLSSAKLISTSACILSTTPSLRINTIPSSAKFAPSGSSISVVPSGSLFVDPLLE